MEKLLNWIVETWLWLWDGTAFLPRGRCGDWGHGIGAWCLLSNFVCAVAFLSIPVSLLWLWQKTHRQHELSRELWAVLWVAFFCGLHHAWMVLSFYWPIQRIATVFITIPLAFVSLWLACRLPLLIPRIDIGPPEPQERRLEPPKRS